MKTEPQKEHQWLQKLVGEWEFESEAAMGSDQPSEKFSGTESVRSLGSLWIVAEGRGDMPGEGAATMIMTLGYDPQKGQYVGTFIASMETHLWVYEGSLDGSERMLALDTVGPNMAAEGKMAKYKDVIEFKSDDHRTLTSHMLGEDGEWNRVMVLNYRRKK